MEPELNEAVRGYLADTASHALLADLVDSYDIWNADQDQDAEILALRPAVGRLELLLTEVAEGLRPETELRAVVAEIIAGTPNASRRGRTPGPAAAR